jgi:hypothetical protein
MNATRSNCFRTLCCGQCGGGLFVARVLCAALLGVVQTAAFADDGLFEVTRAETRQLEGAWLLDGRIDLELSSEAIDALESGVMLTIQMQFELYRQRSFWIDDMAGTTTRDFELKYMALNQRYLVRNITTGDQQDYATLFSALRNMGRIRDWSVVPSGSVQNDSKYNCSLRAVLNQDRLPGPLQLLAFWRGDFSHESDWFRWKLR